MTNEPSKEYLGKHSSLYAELEEKFAKADFIFDTVMLIAQEEYNRAHNTARLVRKKAMDDARREYLDAYDQTVIALVESMK